MCRGDTGRLKGKIKIPTETGHQAKKAGISEKDKNKDAAGGETDRQAG